jgi:hypothetical protein
MIVSTSRRRLAALAPELLLIAGSLLCLPASAAETPPPASTRETTLTREELARLLIVVQKQGSPEEIPPSVASMLDLQPNQVTPTVRQVAFLDENGIKHGFGPLNDHSGFFMFRSGAAQGQSVYHVDSKLQLVRAARSFLRQQLMVLPDVEAQKELDEEFGHWSKVLSPGGRIVQPPASPFKPPAAVKP